MCTVVKLSERLAQVDGHKQGESASTVLPTTVLKPSEAVTNLPKEVVEVKDDPNLLLLGKQQEEGENKGYAREIEKKKR